MDCEDNFVLSTVFLMRSMFKMHDEAEAHDVHVMMICQESAKVHPLYRTMTKTSFDFDENSHIILTKAGS